MGQCLTKESREHLYNGGAIAEEKVVEMEMEPTVMEHRSDEVVARTPTEPTLEAPAESTVEPSAEPSVEPTSETSTEPALETPAEASAEDALELSDFSGAKKGLIIGINYSKSSNKLMSCVEDAKNMYRLLTEQYGYAEEQIVMLTDEEEFGTPTARLIILGLEWLLKDAKKNDSLFFYFSGHGFQIPDTKGNELDGLNEGICPVDYENAGILIDDQLKCLVVDRLPKGCRITVVMDCCHAGSMLDLAFEYNHKGEKCPTRKAPASPAPLADVILISGCQDEELSADLSIQDIGRTSAFTLALTNALREHPYSLSYKQLLESLQSILSQDIISQSSFLSAGYPLDLDSKFRL